MFRFRKKNTSSEKENNILLEETSTNDTTDKEKNVFEKNVRNLKDLIAVDYIDFAEDPTYGRCGEKYIKNMYIGTLPANVKFASSFHSLYNHENIDTSIFINPISSEVAKAELSKLRSNLEGEYLTAGGSNNRRDDMSAKVQETTIWRNEIRDGINKFYEVNIQSTLYASNIRDLNNSASRLRASLSRRDIGIKSAIYDQEKAYLSNKPLMNNQLGEWHTFDKRSLACLFPFTSNNINHQDGVPIGFNIDNGLPIIYNNFDDSLANYNMVVFAKSGGGKSSFMKMLSSRGITFDDIMNIAIDIEPEYRDIAEILGGVNIDISPASDTILNPFDITLEKVKDKITGRMVDKVGLKEKINSVTSVLLTMAKGFTSANTEYYNDITRGIIKECVIKCYMDLGITEDVESIYTYKEDESSLLGIKTRKDMPTLSAWYKKLREEAKNNKKETYDKYYDYLLMVMKEYCKCTNGGFTCFDGQSTIHLNYDIPFINFDLSQLNETTELPLAQHIVTDFIWESMIKTNNTGKRIRVIIEEAWRLAKIINGEPKFPEALAFLDTMFRRSRKKNTSAVIISQQFNEFYNDLTQSIIKNADTKVFLPPDETSVDDIKEVFKLTDGEAYYLKRTNRGEALFKCGSASYKLQVEIPEFELDFVETNQNVVKKSKEQNDEAKV